MGGNSRDREAVKLIIAHAATPGGEGLTSGAVSTRRLILAALLCGLAILVAFTVQILVGR
jgi:hypothetical protein